jgi:hypothetical protein
MSANGGKKSWMLPAVVGLGVLAAQLGLVAVAGTDVPFQDQWDVEGRGLYPAWLDGTLRAGDLLRAHNEHRIAWTHLLNLGLFAVSGQWDPLVQRVAGAMLRAASAAGLVWLLGKNLGVKARAGVAVGVGLAFLPVLAWHNVLWGFQSSVYFVILFSLGALALLGAPEISGRRRVAGLGMGVAALLAMGAGAFVPVALLGLAAVRAGERRSVTRETLNDVWPALILLAAALALRGEVPENATQRAGSAAQFFATLGHVLAWPHVEQPWAAVAMNAPLALVVIGRMAGRRRGRAGEDFAVLLGGWAWAGALATAWARGGSDEFAAGVPSRYADFFGLLLIANAWCAVALIAEAPEPRRQSARWIAGAWGAFLLIGWLGLSTQMLRRVILPRARDREAPVRLVREFQRTGDAGVFAGQPRLLVPHPNVESVRVVLADPRMAGRLPPSLQPERPMGSWSRAVRWLLGRQ